MAKSFNKTNCWNKPRGKTIKRSFYEKDLLKDKKELAEHSNVIRFGRNDAGKSIQD